MPVIQIDHDKANRTERRTPRRPVCASLITDRRRRKYNDHNYDTPFCPNNNPSSGFEQQSKTAK